MDALYFTVMLAGVAWLAVWSVLPKPHSEKYWWPFDMRQDAPGATPSVPGTEPSAGEAPRTRRSWRARGLRSQDPGGVPRPTGPAGASRASGSGRAR